METLSTILYVILALLALCVMILVHELGHYTIGRLLGFRILEFSIGFGKAIWQKEKNGILYSLRMIPLGGYCKFFGEDDQPDENGESTENKEGAMNAMPAWKRVCVLAAGVTFNVIFAVIVAVGLVSINGVVTYQIAEVAEGAPADGVLQADDRIVEVENRLIFSGSELGSAVSGQNEVHVTVLRDGQTVKLTLIPEITVDEEGNTVKRVGISMGYANAHVDVGTTLRYAFGYVGYVFDSVISAFEGIFSGAIGIKDGVGGPITTVVQIVELERTVGVEVLFDLLILISINLALFNILPFPSLDGARILFVVIYAIAEKIAGRKLSHKVEAYIHAAGLILLFGLIIFIEVIRLF